MPVRAESPSGRSATNKIGQNGPIYWLHCAFRISYHYLSWTDANEIIELPGNIVVVCVHSHGRVFSERDT